MTNSQYKDWLDQSSKWQGALRAALKKHGGDDLVVPYRNVCLAFPSIVPNEFSFDYPLIDQDKLIEWARSEGWVFSFAPEMTPEKDKQRAPVVRFTRAVA